MPDLISATGTLTTLLVELSKQNPPGLDQRLTRTAVEEAIRETQREAFGALHKEDVGLTEEARQRMLAFLDREAFCEEIANHLIFEGRPNLQRLREHYLSEEGETGEQWWALIQQPLIKFFKGLENRLLAHPLIGIQLRQADELRIQKQIDETVQGIFRTLEAVADELREKRETDHSLLQQIADNTAPPKPFSLETDLTDKEVFYLRDLAANSDVLPLALDSRSQNDQHAATASLANVYVDLTTTSRPDVERLLIRAGVPKPRRSSVRRKLPNSDAPTEGDVERHAELTPRRRDIKEHPLWPFVKDEERLQGLLTETLTLLEAVFENREIVLLGDPGSGKSTFVNHLAHTFAQAWLGEDDSWTATLGGLFEKPLFPIRIVLRKWSKDWTASQGKAAFYEALAAQSNDISLEHWQKRLEHENTLVLLDGLDEVPTAAGKDRAEDRRKQLLEAVKAFRTSHPNCRVLVTCRVKPYAGEYRLQGWPSFELAPLDMPRIERFCRRWYAEQERTGRLKATEGQDCLDRLLPALREREILRQMAGTPLLLTMLARVNARSRLPEGRVELYEECIDQLLWEWEKSKTGKDGEVQKLDDLLQEPDPPLRRADLERLLWRLTFELHGQSGDDLIDLSTSRLREELAEIHPHKNAGWTWASELIDLMSDRSGLLIATSGKSFTFPHRSFQEYLAARGLLEESNAPIVAVSKAAEDIWWEVILLACGHLSVAGRYSDVQNIVQELITAQDPAGLPGARRILLAGMAWSEFGHHRKVGAVGADLHGRLPGLLTRAMQCSALPAPQRHAAGLIASDFGDLPADLDAFVTLPEEWFGYPFQIARYPVTNAQYRRFMEDGGYDRESGWFGEEARQEMQKRAGRGDATQPRFWNDPTWNRATQPVVGVSWYEAEAYCKWLTAKMRAAAEIGDDQHVRLPTFEERKRAAEGATERKFPWGDEEEVHRLNCEESKIGLASPVHMYPDGATSERVWDLSGNVWEWTSTKDEKDFPAYALGGGACYKNISLNTSAARHWNFAHDGWGYRVGFRVSVSPLLL